MAKVKYYYDSETLSYRKIKRKKTTTIKYVSVFLTAAALFGFLSFFIVSQYIESPKERQMARELQNMELQFELINKRTDDAFAALENVEERDNAIYRLYFEANPIPTEQRRAGFGGINRYKKFEGFDNSQLIAESNKRLDVLEKAIVVQSKSLDEIVALAKEKENMLASIPAIQPVKKEDLTRMASGYGMRMHPILKYKKMHKGMDFTAAVGTPIFASGNGKVIRAERSATFGNVVYIEHGYGYKTIYAHMSKIKAKKGDKVKRGDLIGYVGNTGRSVSSHLHYEVHKNDRALNPINFYYGDLSPEEFIAMQKAAEEEGQSYD